VRPLFSTLAIAALAVALPGLAVAQEDDAALKLAEPDFTVISLPTSLRLPRFGSAFRVTHRFQRTLGEGDFGDLAGDLFGLDNGATIGLEYRFGIVPNGQIGFHRSSRGKTIEFFGQYGVLRQAQAGFDLAVIATVEGLDNFQESRSPALGAIIGRTAGEVAAFYIEPMWVNNTNPLPSALADDNDTVSVGLGARVRIRPTVYISGEWVPRVSGYEPDVAHGGFALEKRAGGHVFQLNFTNSFATTPAQTVRGGTGAKDWYLGFAISRKFF
jgi:hypothetical protein